MIQELCGNTVAAALAIAEAIRIHDERGGMLAVTSFEVAARIAVRCGADEAAAQLLEAAERTAAEQAISTSALDRYWRDPVRKGGSRRRAGRPGYRAFAVRDRRTWERWRSSNTPDARAGVLRERVV